MIDLGKRFPDRQVNSTNEPLELQLVRYGVPVDLSTAVLSFAMTNAITGEALELQGAATGASNGVASYQPAAADVSAPGLYKCQFVAEWTAQNVLRSELVQLRIMPHAAPPIASPTLPR